MMNIIYVAFAFGICISLTDAGSSCDPDKIGQCLNGDVCKEMENDIKDLSLILETGLVLGECTANAEIHLCGGGYGYGIERNDLTGNLTIIAIFKGSISVDVKTAGEIVAEVEGNCILNITFVGTWDQYDKLRVINLNSSIEKSGELKVTILKTGFGAVLDAKLPADILLLLNTKLSDLIKEVFPIIEGCLDTNNACSKN